MSKKIIFLLKSAGAPSSRIRFPDLEQFLQQRGVTTEIVVLPKSALERLKLYKRCAQYDAVVLQKKLITLPEFAILRKFAKKLAFDFCDAIYLKDRSPSVNFDEYRSASRNRRFKRIIQGADLVVAGSQVLADYAAQYKDRSKITVLSSSVNIANSQPKQSYELNRPPIIGWMGTKATQRYVKQLAPYLSQLRQKHDFVLHIVSNYDFEYDGLAVKNIPWSLETEHDVLVAFDIGIMPLSYDPFAAGKGGYKLLQYMYLGIPSVASAVGVNCSLGNNDTTALIADHHEDFIKKLEMLLTDRQLRISLGQKGKAYVEAEYSREVIGKRFADIYENLLN